MTEIEKLEAELKNTSDISKKLETLNNLSQYFWDKDLQRALEYVLEAVDLARDTDDMPILVKSLGRVGACYRSLLKTELAEKYLLEALTLATDYRLEDMQTILYNSLGVLYQNNGDLERAIEFFKDSAAIARKYNQYSHLARAVCNVGVCYAQLGDYTEALEFYLQSKRIFEDHTDESVAPILKRMGGLFMESGNLNKGLEYFLKALKLHENQRDVREMGPLLSDIATAYEERGENEAAFNNYYQALELFSKTGDRYYVVITQCLFAGLCFKTAQIQHGWELLAEAREVLKESNAPYLEGLVLLYEGIGSFTENKIELAEKHLEEALAIARQSKNEMLIQNTLYRLSLVFEEQQEHAKAVEVLQESLDISAEKRSRSAGYLKAIEALCRIYEKTGRVSEAFALYKRYYEIEKEVAVTESELVTTAMFVEFETEKARQQSEIYRLKNIELADANTRLKELGEERKEFISFAAHDLRNPLYSIKMLLRLLKESADMSEEKRSEVLDDIETSTSGMLDLVQNLLDTEIIESGKLQFNSNAFLTAEIIDNLVERYQPAAEAKNLTIHCDLNEEILTYADSRHFVQVIDNILSNAIKYSPFEKNIFIRLLENGERGMARIEIQDEGPGIDAADLKKLFGKFQRLTAQPTANEHSTGLGLSIVKKLVEAMNGKVWCESEIGQGSTFIIELPLAVREPVAV